MRKFNITVNGKTYEVVVEESPERVRHDEVDDERYGYQRRDENHPSEGQCHPPLVLVLIPKGYEYADTLHGGNVIFHQ